MTTNHSPLTTTPATADAAPDALSMFTAHASLLHDCETVLLTEPILRFRLGDSLATTNLVVSPTSTTYAVARPLEYDIDVHAEDTNFWILLHLREVCVISEAE